MIFGRKIQEGLESLRSLVKNPNLKRLVAPEDRYVYRYLLDEEAEYWKGRYEEA